MTKLTETLREELLLTSESFYRLYTTAPRRYKVYEIPKKSGGVRTIAQPAREIKRIQYWILSNFIMRFQIHPQSFAYVRGLSILNNANAHKNSRFLLKLDILNFFNSIKVEHFRNFMNKFVTKDAPFDHDDLDILSTLLFWQKRTKEQLCLSIGAPTSPALSNVLMYDFDKRINEEANQRSLIYTRYADDLCFSATEPDQLNEIPVLVQTFLEEARLKGLVLNEKKTIHLSKKSKRMVTGLVITNDRNISIGRDKKRKISAALHHFILGLLDKGETARLAGMLAFVNSVEKEFLIKLEKKYGVENIRRLLAEGQRVR